MADSKAKAFFNPDPNLSYSLESTIYMTTRILGIDPGLQHTGWGVIEVIGNRLSFIASGAIHSKSSEEMSVRLTRIHEELSAVIERHLPHEAAIEETFVNKNPMASLKLGHARGAAILTLGVQRLSVSEYAATLVKKTVTGVGRAEKNQVAMMIGILLPGAKATSPDAFDALAVAICHAQHRSPLATAS